MHALEIHVVTLDASGRSEIRAVIPRGRSIMTLPGVAPGPDGLERAIEKIRAALPDAALYDWRHALWRYAPTRCEVRKVLKLWLIEPAED